MFAAVKKSRVLAWFDQRYGTPTPAQRAAWPLIARGENVLIASPTGTGKTFAAFLSVLDALAAAHNEGELCDAIHCVYVSPLRALSYDLEKNLNEPLRQLFGDKPPIRVALRTGVTTLGGRVPVINFSGGTEVGGSFLAPYPVEPIRSCSLGGPSLGMDVDVVDDTGRSVRGQVGELVCRQPWPSMTRGIWKDDERYLEAYWSRFPGIWTHGDFAMVDNDGQWFILGRSDDVIISAGWTMSALEIEQALLAHPEVREAAVIGVPDELRGQIPKACIVAPGKGATFAAELQEFVKSRLSQHEYPRAIEIVTELPKTPAGKIDRKTLRDRGGA